MDYNSLHPFLKGFTLLMIGFRECCKYSIQKCSFHDICCDKNVLCFPGSLSNANVVKNYCLRYCHDVTLSQFFCQMIHFQRVLLHNPIPLYSSHHHASQIPSQWHNCWPSRLICLCYLFVSWRTLLALCVTWKINNMSQ